MSSIYWYFFVFAATLSCFCDAQVLIKSVKSGLVFDGNGENVKAVKQDHNPGHVWILEGKQNGHFVIVNAKNKLALDVQKGCGNSENIMVYEKHSRDNQQFYINSDGTIGTSCGKDLILQIENGNVKTVKKSQACGLDIHFELVHVK